jgi:hypothetical protein
LDLLQEARDRGLMQFGENVQRGVNFIPQQVITPVDSAHKTVLMAIERGMLPNLIFDNQALTSHRVMAAILGGILRLPPVKQAMASEQVRSRYLVKLLDWGQTHFTVN